MQTLFMETTQIEASQTVSEIQRILGMYGASAIRIDYSNGEVSSVSFLLRIGLQDIPFRLPCRWEAIKTIIQSRRKRTTYRRGRPIKKDPDQQAKRIAWRQILRWVEAQLALVGTQMVSMQEVFMPYMQVGKGETLYERLERNEFQLLEDKREKE